MSMVVNKLSELAALNQNANDVPAPHANTKRFLQI
jgi:hypothetical protein